MESLNRRDLHEYIDENIIDFLCCRIEIMKKITLYELLDKNFYLLRAKRSTGQAYAMIQEMLDVYIVPVEEGLFGDFLKDLAIFVALRTTGGDKSCVPGIDLEFFNKGIHYLVSIKSCINWGNSSQQHCLEEDFKKAVIGGQQSKFVVETKPVLGICYGKTRTEYMNGYLKVVGQNFWYFISENIDLYTDIVELIGHRSQEHKREIDYPKEMGGIASRLTRQFFDEFCTPDLQIDWVKLVEFNSGNFDLDHFGKE